MPKRIRIDFVSDVACPWCVIGLLGLEQALARLNGVVEAEIHFQPFELNPNMPPEGENAGEHMARKYGAPPAQRLANREAMRARAAALGFTMAKGDDSRIYNTFDAYRLLHWAGLEGREAALKHALLETYFTLDQNPTDPQVLIAAAERAGLDGEAAREVIASGRYGPEVREAEKRWLSAGINSVPAIVIDKRYLISGGQPPEMFEQALRRIAQQAA
jgi:predicted DsbA family dithiol-disulfide isomerase